MMRGTPAITITLPMKKPGARETGLSTRSAPAGMRAMRSLAGVRSASLSRSRSMARARGSMSMVTPNAFATASAVMSSWVGPIPPVVKT